MICVYFRKFAQDNDPTNVVIMDDPKKFLELFADDNYQVMQAIALSDHQVLVEYKLAHPGETISKASNLLIASFVTAQARVHLYKALSQVAKDVVYYDTGT